jgi:hypothetical protein
MFQRRLAAVAVVVVVVISRNRSVDIERVVTTALDNDNHGRQQQALFLLLLLFFDRAMDDDFCPSLSSTEQPPQRSPSFTSLWQGNLQIPTTPFSTAIIIICQRVSKNATVTMKKENNRRIQSCQLSKLRI